jgi:hypothetical protein
VCLRCGYAEEGWHCGYWKLHRGVFGKIGGGPIRSMTRENGHKHVRGGIMTQSKLSEIRY